MRKVFFTFATLIFVASLALSSCKDEMLERSKPMKIGKNTSKGDDDNYPLKKEFALALHRAMSENVALREFIKAEALKMFDNDYEVLWNYVKDNEVKGTGKTLHNLLAPYFEGEATLIQIEQELPLLTILVPTLPEDCFSAEKWDTETEVPMVATRIRGAGMVPVFSSIEGESFLIPGELIPAYPVVVVKDNESIILSNYLEYNQKTEFIGYVDENGENQFATIEKPEYSSASGDFKFKFAFSNFDRNKLGGIYTGHSPENDPNASNYNVAGGQKVYEMWQMCQPGAEQEGQIWQRDYIYYRLANTYANGEYHEDYMEFVPAFKIKARDEYNGVDVLAKIADDTGYDGIKGDPIFNKDGKSYYWDIEDDYSRASELWTDGFFEFKIYVNTGEKVPVGAENKVYTNGFIARLNELFMIEYKWDYDNWWWKLWGKRHYKIKSAKPLWFWLGNTVPINVPWRLEEFSNKWRIRWEEIDSEITKEKTEVSGKKYNTNFELNTEITPIKILKIGAKLGLAAEQSTSVSEKVTYTEKSDELAENIPIKFGEDIILRETIKMGHTVYFFKTYEGTYCEFQFRPMKVTK